VEDERGPLVAGEAPGEANGQRVRVEQRPGCQRAPRAHTVFRPEPTRPFPDEREQVKAQRAAHAPDLLVWDLEHAIPELRLVMMFQPVPAKMLLEERRHLA
jgi:hypothetical protein